MHLLIRRTLGYYNGGIALTNVIKDPGTAEAAIDRWNLKIPYMEFRGELRLIASLTLEQKWQSIVPWSDKETVRGLSGMLLPVDEDDWLHPELLGSVMEDGDVITWDVIRKEANGGAPKDEKKFVESCGYAIKLPCPFEVITNHLLVPKSAAHKVDKVLAVRNETPASVAFLLKGGSPKEAVQQSLRNERQDRKRLPDWAEVQADEYYALLRKC